jgi:ring-1,2-phenylacetyl-CoA epoxidase subunit PaaE
MGGTCGTCRAKVVAGAVEMDHNLALDATEVEDGYVLTCQSHPASPAVTIDYNA